MTKISIFLVMAALLLAGCGASANAANSAPPEVTEEEAPAATEEATVEPTDQPIEEPTKEPPVPVISPDQLGGMWFSGGNTALYHTFAADGIFRAAFEKANLPDQPDVQGKYWFEDGVFMIEDTAYSALLESESCAGIVGSYSVELRSGNRLFFTPVEDACEVRARSLSTVLGHGQLEQD